MSKVRSKDTKPELFVRKLLFKAGYRYRLQVSNLPGKPDIVLKKYKTALFVHGCFWHGHTGCHRSSRPADNKQFWETKIAGNIARDNNVSQALLYDGWRVLIIWECACLKTRSNELLSKIEAFLKSEATSAEIGKNDFNTPSGNATPT